MNNLELSNKRIFFDVYKPEREREFALLPEKIKFQISKAKKDVETELIKMGLSEEAERLGQTSLEELLLISDGFSKDGNTQGFLGMVNLYQGKKRLYLNLNETSENLSEKDMHVLRHEIFHLVSDSDHFEYKDGLWLRYSGLHIVKENGGTNHEEISNNFFGWNEAMTDISAMESGGGIFKSLGYKVFVCVAINVARKILNSFKEDEVLRLMYRKVFNSMKDPENENDVLMELRKQAIKSNFGFIRIVDYLYGENTSKEQLIKLGRKDETFQTLMFFLGVEIPNPEDPKFYQLFDQYTKWFYDVKDFEFRPKS